MQKTTIPEFKAGTRVITMPSVHFKDFSNLKKSLNNELQTINLPVCSQVFSVVKDTTLDADDLITGFVKYNRVIDGVKTAKIGMALRDGSAFLNKTLYSFLTLNTQFFSEIHSLIEDGGVIGEGGEIHELPAEVIVGKINEMLAGRMRSLTIQEKVASVPFYEGQNPIKDEAGNPIAFMFDEVSKRFKLYDNKANANEPKYYTYSKTAVINERGNTNYFKGFSSEHIAPVAETTK